MTDEPKDTGPIVVPPPDGDEWVEDVTVAVLRGVLDLMDREDVARPDVERHWLALYDFYQPTPDELRIGHWVIEAAKDYIYALAGAKTLDFVGHLRFRKKGRTGEILGEAGPAAAAVVITPDTPREALSVLRDLDVTAPAVRGKVLCWDPATAGWRPSGVLPDELNKGTSTD